MRNLFSVLRCPAALITQPLQAGGWVPTPSGGVGLQRTGSGRVLQPADKKKRRGAVLRLFDMLRCAWVGDWVAMHDASCERLLQHSSPAAAASGQLGPALWASPLDKAHPSHGALAGASVTRCCPTLPGSCPTPAT